MSSQTYPISGMTCQHCVAQVHALLASVPGVKSVMVSLMPPRAHIEGDDIDLTALASALAATQFTINTAPTMKPTVSR